jgi:hypothetical protein
MSDATEHVLTLATEVLVLIPASIAAYSSIRSLRSSKRNNETLQQIIKNTDGINEVLRTASENAAIEIEALKIAQATLAEKLHSAERAAIVLAAAQAQKDRDMNHSEGKY